MINLVVVALLLVCAVPNYALNNGLALTPPMGWMTWQRYRCEVDCKANPMECISEYLLLRMASKMVKDGWLELGYKYLVVDDCWFARSRDANGKLQPDSDRFPHGMKFIGDSLHALGLKFGIYLDYGSKTCAGFPGSLGHMEEDIDSLVEWGVDYLKMDGCWSNADTQADGYEKFSEYITSKNHSMVFSCSYPAYADWRKNESLVDWKRLQKNCHLWRMLQDVEDAGWSVESILRDYASYSNVLQPLAGPGSWNDPDMLVLNNYGLSNDQERTQMGMWAMFAAPLFMSTDLYSMKPNSASLLKNKLLLAIDQDKGGHQAVLIQSSNNILFWVRDLEGNGKQWAIAIVNNCNGGAPVSVTFKLMDFGINQTSEYPKFNMQEVFTKNVRSGIEADMPIVSQINPHGIEMSIITPSK